MLRDPGHVSPAAAPHCIPVASRESMTCEGLAQTGRRQRRPMGRANHTYIRARFRSSELIPAELAHRPGQRIDRTTPPSTRRAAPLVAEARPLQI